MRFQKIILIFILLLAASLRLYRINEYMTFLGDEGRDVLVVKRMIVDLKPTLLGPITSVGSIYMGPVYYYMMSPFLWLFRLDPVGPAVMVALVAVATVSVLYFIGRDFFSSTVGLFSAFFYSVSPLTITYGRSSWNPNVVPLFASLLMYGLLKTVVHKRFRWLTISAFCLGILIQLHYITFLFFPIIFACLALIRFRVPLTVYMMSFGLFLLAYSPFLAFEVRHGFMNAQGVVRFVSEQQGGSGVVLLEAVLKAVSDVFVRLFWRLLVIENAEWTKGAMTGIAVLLAAHWGKTKKETNKRCALLIVLLWFFLGLAGYGAYHGVIYDYYMGSLFPVPFLLFSIAMHYCLLNLRWGKAIVIMTTGTILFFNLTHSPLLLTPNNQLGNTRMISRFVHEKANGNRYNFALIAGRNSDHAYRYFFDIWGNPPVQIENPVVDPQRRTVMNELLIICEEKICQPLGHALWEIAGFGPAEIAGEWQVSTARVFKLIQYNPSN